MGGFRIGTRVSGIDPAWRSGRPGWRARVDHDLSYAVLDDRQMSFFGFDQPNSLEDEKRRFLEGGAQAALQQDDVAVYTWGEESYDGLGDALQEGGDELNDETFGGTGQVGACALPSGRAL